jgi:hypothetical protein
MYTPHDLNELLRQMYGEVRGSKGERYSKSSFVGLRAGVQRHIQGPPFNREMNIINDRSNHVFQGVMRQLKAEGLDSPEHKEPITEEDWKKLYESGLLNQDNPTGLQNQVFVNLLLHFGRRGREGLTSLTKRSFVIRKFPDGI